jgi:hypothetical protein
MVDDMKESTEMIRSMGSEYTAGLTKENIRVIGSKANSMV